MISKKPSIVKMSTVDGQEDVQAVRVVSDAEERGFADWLNQALARDPMCSQYLPLTGCQIYDKCADGMLFCKMINYAVHDTIDERAINSGSKLDSVFCKNENLSLAVQSAAAIGCCTVNIGPIDLGRGVRHIVLGLLWQIIRIGLIGNINLVSHAELVALLRPGETLEDLMRLSPEQMLIRWVNYHLEKAGSARRISNFQTDIMDSEIYANLLGQICPATHRSSMMSTNQVLAPNALPDRAENVLRNAGTMGARAFLEPVDIAQANQRGKNRERLNMAFVANLFNLYPALEVDQEAIQDLDIREETLEEKMYRNWMNSMGADPYVNDLYGDLRNGLILLFLIDVLEPRTVNWDNVYKTFNPVKKLFQMQENCNLFLMYAKKLGIKLVNVAGENIRETDPVLVLGICFQLLRSYTFRLLHRLQVSQTDQKPIEDRDIIEWANRRTAASGLSISSFKDTKIRDGQALGELIEAIRPGSVDRSLLLSSDSLEVAKYVITVARKIGANIYALPQHVVQLNPKMILTVYACLMLVDLQQQHNAN